MRALIFAFFLLLWGAVAEAGLRSPFPSSVEGVELPNTHQVDTQGLLFRGMAPFGHFEELVDLGVEHFLIFKNQTRNEVDKEVKALKGLGYSSSQIHQIEFPYKGFDSQINACKKAIAGLKLIKKINERGQTLFFHCTVGEDRTGFLAGLYRMLTQEWSKEKAFKYEMCENGYGRGNKKKPNKVVYAIRGELTPLFNSMSYLIEFGILTWDNLDENLCHHLPERLEQRKCRWSSKLDR